MVGAKKADYEGKAKFGAQYKQENKGSVIYAWMYLPWNNQNVFAVVIFLLFSCLYRAPNLAHFREICFHRLYKKFAYLVHTNELALTLVLKLKKFEIQNAQQSTIRINSGISTWL